MSVTDHQLVNDWLSQFDVPDRFVAQYMLERIRYISFQEFESSLQTQVQSLIDRIDAEHGREAIALFPVEKESSHRYNHEKEHKPSHDSAGRIAHSVKNITRDLPGHIELSPRINSMKQKKVRHVVLIDDMIGSGDRIKHYWQNSVSPQLKSWISLGWCTVWILVHAAHVQGIRRIASSVKAVSEHRITASLRIDRSFFHYHRSVRELNKRYETTYLPRRFSTGYSSLLFPVIFQHGCPNNAPGLLWYRAPRKKSRGWKPLFPNRTVSAELYPLFQETQRATLTEEELWVVGRYQAALNFIDRERCFNGSRLTLVTLTHLHRGYTLRKIKSLLVASDAELAEAISELKRSGLVTAELKITPFGAEFLRRIGRPRYPQQRNSTSQDDSSFYPSSFMGFQRDV